MDNDIEQQKKLEADAVRDGLLRYAKSYDRFVTVVCDHSRRNENPRGDVERGCLTEHRLPDAFRDCLIVF